MFNRRFKTSQYIGVFCVVCGLVLVGFSNLHSYNSRFAPKPILGNILVIIAQLFLACMFVYEEKILKEYKIKVMEIVGWEGVWGALISLLFIAVFYYLPGEDFGSAENPIQATLQVLNNNHLLFGMLISTFVIGPFNYFGTSLTKEASAMHRCLVDASRMCIVWFISMCCSWETFKSTQALGYGMIMIGNILYYDILIKTPEIKLKADPEEDTIAIKENKQRDERNTSFTSENHNLKNIIKQNSKYIK